MNTEARARYYGDMGDEFERPPRQWGPYSPQGAMMLMLQARVGAVAQAALDGQPEQLRAGLAPVSVAAMSIALSVDGGAGMESRARYYCEMGAEYERQGRKWGHDGPQHLETMMLVLQEEVGEVARAALEDQPEQLREELVQVSTTAMTIRMYFDAGVLEW